MTGKEVFETATTLLLQTAPQLDLKFLGSTRQCAPFPGDLQADQWLLTLALLVTGDLVPASISTTAAGLHNLHEEQGPYPVPMLTRCPQDLDRREVD